MQNIYDARQKGKLIFLLISVLLVGGVLYVSNDLVEDLSIEERKKMEIWAEATRELASDKTEMSMELILKVIQSNTSIPAIIVDDTGEINQYLNLNLPETDTEKYLQEKLEQLKSKSNLIEINLGDEEKQYLYYDDSILLKRLSLYPYVQLGVMVLFVLIVYFALISTKKAEQNKVWVGLSKETAHQLGTPISSLMAWMDLLESSGVDSSLLSDMNKDVNRLSVIAERFSKIGSKPEMELIYVNEVLENATEYMRRRVSDKVLITTHLPSDAEGAMVCLSLFEWVIENLCKNAVDAMNGEGRIDVYMTSEKQQIYIDIKDTGKGIARKNFKTVFNPGYTTKKRGWGLGLTLAKRIIEDYHAGRIYVKDSEVGKGTTFRIELRRVV
ncbi:sensor histidine kinase [Barnesiella intestinihominis]|uniref:sensor histidine kinase n=1 Tax=Barnesiella intestinihominis TaxID=487174 RepID=UPI002FE3A2AF